MMSEFLSLFPELLDELGTAGAGAAATGAGAAAGGVADAAAGAGASAADVASPFLGAASSAPAATAAAAPAASGMADPFAGSTMAATPDLTPAQQAALSSQARQAGSTASGLNDPFGGMTQTPSWLSNAWDKLTSKETVAGLGKMMEQKQAQSKAQGTAPSDPRVNPAQMGTGAGLGRSGGAGLSSLVQALLARRYMPPGYGGNRSSGLLG